MASSTDNIDGINSFLEDGGKLLFIPPQEINLERIKSMEQSIQLPSIKEFVSNNPNTADYVDFNEINNSHPIFINLFESKRSKTINSPNIFKYLNFANDPKVNPIITLVDGSVFLGEYRIKNGTVLFFNTASSLEWSNLPFKGIYAPLISRIIYYLTSINESRNSFFVGEQIPIEVSGISIPLIDVSLPSGNDKFRVNSGFIKKVTYKNTSQVGSYKFFNDDKLLTFATVNIDHTESDLRKLENELIEDFYTKMFGNNYIIFKNEDNYFDKIYQARYGTELWKYFLIIVLLLAMIEMYIARSTKKDLMEVN